LITAYEPLVQHFNSTTRLSKRWRYHYPTSRRSQIKQVCNVSQIRES
jgi:hypothetical protein